MHIRKKKDKAEEIFEEIMARNLPKLMADTKLQFQKPQRPFKQNKYKTTTQLDMHIQITEKQRENLEGNQKGKKPYLQREYVEFSQIMSNLFEMQYRKLNLLNKELELQLK